MNDPRTFLLEALPRTATLPFQQERLNESAIKDSLGLSAFDTASIGKARATALCMALSICFRGVSEAFVLMNDKGGIGFDGIKEIMIKSSNLFDSVVETERCKADLPQYVNDTYFQRWRRRYEESALQTNAPPLRIAYLTTFFRQATFSYADEHAVAISEGLLVDFGEDIYDNFTIGLREVYGQNILK